MKQCLVVEMGLEIVVVMVDLMKMEGAVVVVLAVMKRTGELL